ncbi:MAG: response regulator [Myxococcota bacterium]
MRANIYARQRVLVVDDSEVVLDATRLMLEYSGFEVMTLPTPFGTTSIISNHQPDLVLLDVTMPALRGDALVEMIRAGRTSRATRIALHSDRPARELRDLAHRCGADGFICKTDDPDELARQVRQIIG